MPTLQQAIAQRRRAKGALGPLDALNAFRELIDLAEEMRGLKVKLEDALKLADEMPGLKARLEDAVTQSKAAYKGDPGKDAPPVDYGAIVRNVLPLIPKPKDGKPANERAIEKRILQKIPMPQDGRDGKDALIDHEVLAEKVTKAIVSKKKIQIEHVEGLPQFLKSMQKSLRSGGEGGLRGGGDIVIGGTGITVTRNANGRRVISSTTSGLGYLVATGTINNSNVTFTFVSAPTVVVVNGASYVNGAGVTIAGTTATLDNPVGTGGSIFGLG